MSTWTAYDDDPHSAPDRISAGLFLSPQRACLATAAPRAAAIARGGKPLSIRTDSPAAIETSLAAIEKRLNRIEGKLNFGLSIIIALSVFTLIKLFWPV
jgi:hypothetical protein